MADEFLFGFDCEELQSDENTDENTDDYIPPAEDELKPVLTESEEQNAIQFVDARINFYKEKPVDILSREEDISAFTFAENEYDTQPQPTQEEDKPVRKISTTTTSRASLFLQGLDLEDIMDDLLDISDAFKDDSDHDTNANKAHNETPHVPQPSDAPRSEPIAIEVNSLPFYQTGPHKYNIDHHEMSEYMFSDSDFDDEMTGDDEYNYEECGIGLDQKTLPFDFEKPLRWKPMSTVIIDSHELQITLQIQQSLQYQFESDEDDSGTDSSNNNSSSSDSSSETETDSECYGDNGIGYHDDCDDDVINFHNPLTTGCSSGSSPNSPKFKRFLSTLTPKMYDIILMESSPLRMYGIDNTKDINKISLEYLQCSLLAQDKLYEKIWQTLLRNSFGVRCCNFTGNVANIKRIADDGGCKIFQFVGHCCNPIEVAKSKGYDGAYTLNNIYYDLTKHIRQPLDENYILLECDKCVIDGEWIPISELQKYFEANMNDICIVMSPQHEKMAQLFLDMGFSYIIAIKTFAQNNKNTQKSWQVLDFLHHFYSAILNQECLARAFELAKTASKSSINDVVAKHEMDKITKMFSVMQNVKEDNNNNQILLDETESRFLLLTQGENSQQPAPSVFVVFGGNLKRGDPIETNKLNAKYKTNWNNIIMKPFIGRSKEVIKLYESLINNKMILVGGRENIGRKSIIKRLISYLHQHNYFDDGLFVLDCKSELMHKRKHWKFTDILCFKLSQLGFHIQIQTHKNLYNKRTSLGIFSEGNRLFSRGNIYEPNNLMNTKSTAQPITYMKSVSANISKKSLIPATPSMRDMLRAIEQYNICFVLFNVDCWDNDEVYHFMDEFASKNKNDRSPCIFTMEYQHKIHVSPNNGYGAIPTTVVAPAISQLVSTATAQTSVVKELLRNGPQSVQLEQSVFVEPTHKKATQPRLSRNDTFLSIFEDKQYKFDIVLINPLNKQDIAELFVQLCYYSFDKLEVLQNDELHHLFDGKPGNIKRVAAFYQFLCRTQDTDDKKQAETAITLDSIVTKLNTTHSGWITDFHQTIPRLFDDRSRAINGSRTFGSHLGSLRHIHHLRERSMHPDDLQYNVTVQIQKPTRKNMLNNNRARRQSPAILEEQDQDTADTICSIQEAKNLDDLQPILQGIPFNELKVLLMNHYDTDSYNFNATPVATLQPQESELLAISEHEEDVMSEESVSNHYRVSQIIYADDVQEEDQKNNPNAPLLMLQIQSSHTDELWDTPAIAEYDEYIQDKYANSVWAAIADKNNTNYAKLRDLQGPLCKHFHDITQLKKIQFEKELIVNWFVQCTNGQIEYEAVYIKYFETFWKWFIAMSHIVADLYDIEKYAQSIFLDIFYNECEIERKGFLKNKEIGTFMLILGKKCNELIVVYINAFKKIDQFLLTRKEVGDSANNSQYITNDDKKQQNIFQFIQNNRHLKQLFSTKNGPIDKKAVFYSG